MNWLKNIKHDAVFEMKRLQNAEDLAENLLLHKQKPD
jgi:hypothetical protein